MLSPSLFCNTQDWTQDLCTELLLQLYSFNYFILTQSLDNSLNCPGWVWTFDPPGSTIQNARTLFCSFYRWRDLDVMSHLRKKFALDILTPEWWIFFLPCTMPPLPIWTFTRAHIWAQWVRDFFILQQLKGEMQWHHTMSVLLQGFNSSVNTHEAQSLMEGRSWKWQLQ